MKMGTFRNIQSHILGVNFIFVLFIFYIKRDPQVIYNLFTLEHMENISIV